IAQIAPQDASHSQFVCASKRVCDFGDLARRFVRSKIDRRTDRNSSEVLRLFHGSEQHLVEFVRQRQQLVMIDFNDKRNFVSVLSSDASQYTERRGHAVTAALDRQLHQVFGIEVLRVRGERGASRVLNTLIDRQDRNITGGGKPTMVYQ